MDYEELFKDLTQSPRRFLNSMTWQNRFYWALAARQQKLRWLAMLSLAGVMVALTGAIGGWTGAWWGGLGVAVPCALFFWIKGGNLNRLYLSWQKSITRAALGVRDSLAVVLHHEVSKEMKQFREPGNDRKMAAPVLQPLRLQAENLQNRIGKLRERLDGSME